MNNLVLIREKIKRAERLNKAQLLDEIHVSGHGCRDDQRLMLALIKPKFFVPVHGEYRMQVLHGKTAESMGVDPNNICLLYTSPSPRDLSTSRMPSSA